MKIAIASDIYYPQTNGVAVFAHNLANGLAQAGHEVLVIAPSFTGKYHVKTNKETGVKVVHLTSKRFPFYPDQINKVPDRKKLLGMPMPRLAYKHGIWWSTNPWSEVEDALNKFQPDVIHLQTAETIALGVMSYVKKYNTPLVSTGHAYPDNVTSQLKILKPKFLKWQADAVLRWYMASFLKHAEYATMPTEMAIGDLIPKNRKHFKVTVEALSNGVDLTEFKPGEPDQKVLKKYGVKEGIPRVLYVGRVDPEKSISKVIYAFSNISAKIPEAEFLVVGDGTDLSKLKKLAHDLGLTKSETETNSEDRIKFLGRVMPPDLISLYRTGTLFATASETETQGIVLIEAAATGLPLIAVDAGAVKEICQDGVNGTLCTAGDVENIAKAMEEILTNKKLHDKYVKASLKISERHDLKRTLKRFEEIYQEAIMLKQIQNIEEKSKRHITNPKK